MNPKILKILEFWFGSLEQDPPAENKKMWWSKSDVTDNVIRERFLTTLLQAGRGELKAWEETAYGRLALLLLQDQFSRNMFRDQAQMYAYDAQALDLALRTIQEGMDQSLRPIERVFVYMPLEHSEDLAHQKQCLELFAALVDDVPAEQKDRYKGFLAYAQRHHDIIEQFGRFPHRNAILDRPSTPEEEAFLQQPGSSF